MAALEGTKGEDCEDVNMKKRGSRSASESTVEDFHFVACTELKKEIEEAPDKEVGASEEPSVPECDACLKEEMCKVGTFEAISVPGCNVQFKQEADEFFREPQTKKQRVTEIKKMCRNTRPTNKDDCYALGNYVSAKLHKMNDTQQILAEALIQKVIIRGMRNQLTDNTDLYESPPPQVFPFPYIAPLSSNYARYASPYTGQSASPSANSCSALGKH